MKKYLFIVFACALSLTSNLYARNPLAPDAVLQGAKNEVQLGATLTINGSLVSGTGAVIDLSSASSLKTPVMPFASTVTITGTGALVGTTIIPDSAVPAGKEVYVEGFRVIVTSTAAITGGTLTSLSLQENSSAVSFANIPIASLTGTTNLYSSGTTAVGLTNAFLLNTGGTASKGLKVIGVGSAAATSGTAVVTVYGIIK